MRWMFIGSENSVARLKFDVSCLLPHFTPEQQEAIKKNVVWYDPQNDDQSKGGFINVLACLPRLKQMVDAFKPDVIVLDTLVSVTADVDLNSDKDMRDAVMAALTLMRYGGTDARLLVIHHARPGTANISDSLSRMSSGGFSRNSKVLINPCRAEINVHPGDEDDFTRIVLKGGKVNNGIPFDAFGVKFTENHGFVLDPEFQGDEFREKVGMKAKGKKVTPQDIVVAIQNQGTAMKRSLLIKAVRDAIGKVSESSVQRCIDQAFDQKLIIAAGYGSYTLPGTQPKRYDQDY